MSLPISTPQIIEHLTGLENGTDFSTTFTDGVSSSGSVYISGWYSDVTVPTDAEILAAQDEVELIIESKKYIKKRQADYPSIPDQLDEIYHNGIDSWKAVIKVTKDKYPKG